MKKLIRKALNILFAPYRKWREYRDRKFVERIDRLYFHHDGRGNRFIEGTIHVCYDPKTDGVGNFVGWMSHTWQDIMEALNYTHAQSAEETIHVHKQGQSDFEADINNALCRTEAVRKRLNS